MIDPDRGYPVEIFVLRDVAEDLKCEICAGVMRDAMQCRGCLSSFCEHCIRESVRTHSKCPKCEKVVKNVQLVPNRLVKSLVEKQKILCPKKALNATPNSNDCDWQGLIRKLPDHIVENHRELAPPTDSIPWLVNALKAKEGETKHQTLAWLQELLNLVKIASNVPIANNANTKDMLVRFLHEGTIEISSLAADALLCTCSVAQLQSIIRDNEVQATLLLIKLLGHHRLNVLEVLDRLRGLSKQHWHRMLECGLMQPLLALVRSPHTDPQQIGCIADILANIHNVDLLCTSGAIPMLVRLTYAHEASLPPHHTCHVIEQVAKHLDKASYLVQIAGALPFLIWSVNRANGEAGHAWNGLCNIAMSPTYLPTIDSMGLIDTMLSILRNNTSSTNVLDALGVGVMRLAMTAEGRNALMTRPHVVIDTVMHLHALPNPNHKKFGLGIVVNLLEEQEAAVKLFRDSEYGRQLLGMVLGNLPSLPTLLDRGKYYALLCLYNLSTVPDLTDMLYHVITSQTVQRLVQLLSVLLGGSDGAHPSHTHTHATARAEPNAMDTEDTPAETTPSDTAVQKEVAMVGGYAMFTLQNLLETMPALRLVFMLCPAFMDRIRTLASMETDLLVDEGNVKESANIALSVILTTVDVNVRDEVTRWNDTLSPFLPKEQRDITLITALDPTDTNYESNAGLGVVRAMLTNVRDQMDATSLDWLRGLLKVTPPSNTSMPSTSSTPVAKPLHTVSKEDHHQDQVPYDHHDKDKGMESDHDTAPETIAKPHDDTTHDTGHPHHEDQDKDAQKAEDEKDREKESKMEEEFAMPMPMPTVKTEKKDTGSKEVPDHTLVPRKTYVEEVDLTQDMDTEEQEKSMDYYTAKAFPDWSREGSEEAYGDNSTEGTATRRSQRRLTPNKRLADLNPNTSGSRTRGGISTLYHPDYKKHRSE